jgi:hypothetical protein
LFAKDTVQYFAGISAGYQHNQESYENDGSLNWGAQGGVEWDRHRVSALFIRDTSYNSDIDSLLLSYDHLYPIAKDWDLFAGVSVGHTRHKSKALDYTARGLSYGAQFGTRWSFHENFSSDLGLRYLKHDVKSEGLSLDNSTQAFLNINYHF